jgi:hypothetical protein
VDITHLHRVLAGRQVKSSTSAVLSARLAIVIAERNEGSRQLPTTKCAGVWQYSSRFCRGPTLAPRSAETTGLILDEFRRGHV